MMFRRVKNSQTAPRSQGWGAPVRGGILFLAVVIAAFAAFASETTDRGHQAFRDRQYKQAVEAFEAAAKSDPKNSGIQLWLGRAYGRLAETSSFLTAPRYASKCRQAFEKAVELDPKNLEAWNDLLSYYLEAPGFLGGGVDKAEAAAAKIAALNAAEGHFAKAQVAKKNKELATAEHELRSALSLEPKKPGRHIDLALLLAERGNLAAADAAFAQAAALEPDNPRYLFERGKMLVTQKRDAAEARRLLEAYLKSTLGPDDASPAEAKKLLAQLR